MINLIEKAIEISSYTGNFQAIEKCFDLYKNIFTGINLKIKEFVNNNYKSILFSNKNTCNFDILSICHTDVVKSQNNIYKLTKNGNIINGRGVFDMKSFIISSLLNLKEIIQNNYNLNYGVLIVSDEETGSKNGMEFLKDKIKTKILFDPDNGCKINKIIKENLGSTTIKLIGNINDIEKSSKSIYENFKNIYCEIYDNELDIVFNCSDINIEIRKYLSNCDYEILMLNNYMVNNTDNKYHKNYKKIAENILKDKIEYIIVNTTSDCRFFHNKDTVVICHQATGGDNHKETEWLDYASLLKFKEIQLEFLKNFNH